MQNCYLQALDRVTQDSHHLSINQPLTKSRRRPQW